MKKIKVDNLIFFSDVLGIRNGGPSGYLANLQKALQNLNGGGIDHIAFVCSDEKPSQSKSLLIKLATFLIPSKKYRKKIRTALEEKFSKNQWDDCSLASANYSKFVAKLDKYKFSSITCHWVRDALFIRNYLTETKNTAKLILMSHSPQPPSEEVYERERNHTKNAEKNYEIWKKIEDYAFCRAADVLLFPSKEAIEPYSSKLSYFEKLIKTKEFCFLPTGCNALETTKSKPELRNLYNITTPHVICYIGRHNQIKGYDLLKEIAADILQKRDDVTFLIGGAVSSQIPPLKHKRWVELGFVNPAEVFACADCFILPNRQTYFDLILLEALSIGSVVFASATGGNKSVFNQTRAINLYNTKEQCVELVEKFLNLPEAEKQKIKQKALNAYRKNYTLPTFAQNYIKLIEEIKKC